MSTVMLFAVGFRGIVAVLPDRGRMACRPHPLTDGP